MRLTGLRAAIFAAVLPVMAASPAWAEPDTPAPLTVDPHASTVGFTISARVLITVKRDGQFNDFAGEVSYNPADPAATKVDLTVYTASIDMHNTEHDDLLRSDEFFDVSRHPTMHFVSTGAAVQPDGGLAVTGDLTIRGITKRLVVPLKVVPHSGAGGQRPEFETDFEIDRTEFGLTGGGPKSAGFKVSIGRRVQIHMAIAAAKASPGIRR